MSNIFLSDEEKNAYQSDLRGAIHDNFKRPFLIFRQAEKVIVTENLNYNYLYSDAQTNNDVQSYIVNSGVFYGRIWYMQGIGNNKEAQTTSTSASEFTLRGEPQIRFRNDQNYVRLKLDVSGFNFIEGCKEIQVDNNTYNIFSAARQGGLFFPEFYTIWLEQNS